MMPEKEELIKFLNNTKEAAEKYQVTERTIINWMKKYKIYNPKLNYGCNKLNFDKAEQIRLLYQSNKLKTKDLAKKFGVTITTISRIINNKIYKEKKKNTATINVVYQPPVD
jgi:transposase